MSSRVGVWLGLLVWTVCDLCAQTPSPWQPASVPEASADGFVLVQAGTYREYAGPGKQGAIRRVDDFEMSMAPVTQAQYAEFVKDVGAPAPEGWVGDIPATGFEAHPVIFVNRYDAEAYAGWRSRREGRTYRLPTRAEFEYAARGGRTDILYPWGDEPPRGRANFDPEGTRDFRDWKLHLAPAESYFKNGYGLYGMAGNVWHWVDACEDPVRNRYKFRISNEADMERLIMGGSWARKARFLQLGNPAANYPGLRHPDIGFRLVRAPLAAGKSFAPLVRRLAAQSTDGRTVLLTWQFLSQDSPTSGFNIYRSDVRYEAGLRLNAAPLAGPTHFVDTEPLLGALRYYRVRPVSADGREGAPSEWCGVEFTGAPNNVLDAFLPLPREGSMTPVFGDLDGDGLLDCVIRFSNGMAESLPDPGKPVEIEAFAHGGRFLWRKALADHEHAYGNPNNLPVVVYDMNGDGRAEIACRLQEAGSVYLALLDGPTGRVLLKTPWPDMLTDFARSSSRIHLAVAFLDGLHPSLITQTGIYENERIHAFSSDLTRLWEYRSTGATSGGGSHRLEVADLDGDGRDEVIEGSNCLNPDGSLRWSIFREHVDHAIVRDFLPDRPGLEVFFAVETTLHSGAYLVDASSGALLWRHNHEEDPSWDHAHMAWASDIDVNSPGIEIFITRAQMAGRVLLSSAGAGLAEDFPGDRHTPLQWDGLGAHELLLYSTKEVFSYKEGAFHSLGSFTTGEIPTGSVSMLADLCGDQREELVLVGDYKGSRGVFVVASSKLLELRGYSLTQNREYQLWLARNDTGGYGSYFEASRALPPRP